MQIRDRKFRFSQRAVDELPPHDPASPSREMEYCDAEVTGLRLLVSKTGRKTYYLRYTIRGRKRVARIGEHGPLSVADARKKANDMKRQVLDGEDPADQREAERRMPTLAEFANGQYLDHAKANKRSWDMDETRIRLYLAPRFGRLRLDELRTQEIQRFHDQNRHEMAAATANRILTLLHHMLELAVRWGLLEMNPARGIRKHAENNERQRYLSRDELRRLGKALDAFPNRVAAAYWRASMKIIVSVANREAVDGTGGGRVAQALQRRPNQRGPAVAFIDEAILIGKHLAIARGLLAQGRHLAGHAGSRVPEIGQHGSERGGNQSWYGQNLVAPPGNQAANGENKP